MREHEYFETNDIQEFYKNCEYYISKNIERSVALPTGTKLKNNFKYLRIYLDLAEENSPISIGQRKEMEKYLAKCAYDDEYIAEIIDRSAPQEKLLELLDFVESYLVDEIEKDMYGYGDKCYTSLFNDLELVLRIKQQKYGYKFTSIHDLLVNGYFFDEAVAEGFDRLAAFHTPEECPD